jgi:hypothetical protein
MRQWCNHAEISGRGDGEIVERSQLRRTGAGCMIAFGLLVGGGVGTALADTGATHNGDSAGGTSDATNNGARPTAGPLSAAGSPSTTGPVTTDGALTAAGAPSAAGPPTTGPLTAIPDILRATIGNGPLTTAGTGGGVLHRKPGDGPSAQPTLPAPTAQTNPTTQGDQTQSAPTTQSAQTTQNAPTTQNAQTTQNDPTAPMPSVGSSNQPPPPSIPVLLRQILEFPIQEALVIPSLFHDHGWLDPQSYFSRFAASFMPPTNTPPTSVQGGIGVIPQLAANSAGPPEAPNPTPPQALNPTAPLVSSPTPAAVPAPVQSPLSPLAPAQPPPLVLAQLPPLTLPQLPPVTLPGLPPLVLPQFPSLVLQQLPIWSLFESFVHSMFGPALSPGTVSNPLRTPLLGNRTRSLSDSAPFGKGFNDRLNKPRGITPANGRSVPQGQKPPTPPPQQTNVATSMGNEVSASPTSSNDYFQNTQIGQATAAAVPGVGGILLVTTGGGLIGYRQARAAQWVRPRGVERFLH